MFDPSLLKKKKKKKTTFDVDAAMAEGSPTEAGDNTDKENTEPASYADNMDLDMDGKLQCFFLEVRVPNFNNNVQLSLYQI